MTKKATSADRVRLHDERLIASGGRIIHKLRLSSDAAMALSVIGDSTNESATAIISRLIIDEAKIKQNREGSN